MQTCLVCAMSIRTFWLFGIERSCRIQLQLLQRSSLLLKPCRTTLSAMHLALHCSHCHATLTTKLAISVQHNIALLRYLQSIVTDGTTWCRCLNGAILSSFYPRQDASPHQLIGEPLSTSALERSMSSLSCMTSCMPSLPKTMLR